MTLHIYSANIMTLFLQREIILKKSISLALICRGRENCLVDAKISQHPMKDAEACLKVWSNYYLALEQNLLLIWIINNCYQQTNMQICTYEKLKAWQTTEMTRLISGNPSEESTKVNFLDLQLSWSPGWPALLRLLPGVLQADTLGVVLISPSSWWAEKKI